VGDSNYARALPKAVQAMKKTLASYDDAEQKYREKLDLSVKRTNEETIDEVIALALQEQASPVEIGDEAKTPPIWTTEPPPSLQTPAEQ